MAKFTCGVRVSHHPYRLKTEDLINYFVNGETSPPLWCVVSYTSPVAVMGI